jgi:hypothetical protein
MEVPLVGELDILCRPVLGPAESEGDDVVDVGLALCGEKAEGS